MAWEGWNVGSVTVRRVRVDEGGTVLVQARRHGGDVAGVMRSLLAEAGADWGGKVADGAAITGPLAASVSSLPYVPESICLERALQALKISPNIALSLGGETFVVYCLQDGRIRNMVSSSRCAAGSGEFIIQQLARMGLEPDEGMELARQGRHVSMASRCSVHIKSDATHKLNKGECAPRDIAHTLIVDLAARIHALIVSTSWPLDSIVVSGGLALNGLLVDELRRLLPQSNVLALPESPYLEAYGAALVASGNGQLQKPLVEYLLPAGKQGFEVMPPLAAFVGQVRRLAPDAPLPPYPGMRVLLGVDAGSTTTKAAVLERESGRVVAACYLRTHGNPLRATGLCLAEIQRQIGSCPLEVVQAAVTGSGRDLVSVSLGGCLSFNEILAHARAAREAHPAADTIFEIGGQDAKFISLLGGVPVDYSMNDGCSAGTGSFLEETAASDMHFRAEEIGPLALEAKAPLAFGERCAAFINSEIRTALQAGADQKDILAGLAYAIVKNYLSRVVGTRRIGGTVLLQGGVALNQAIAPAVASLSGSEVVVPKNPELMGCVGAALMARDLLAEGKVAEQSQPLAHFEGLRTESAGSFHCEVCQNRCEVRRLRIGEQTYPFGGLCSRWEMQRRPKSLRYKEGKDLVGLRDKLMFGTFAPEPVAAPRGRVGLPLALSTYELYPFYARLLSELGFEVVLSRPGQGRRNTHATLCYPAELLHAAADDLLAQGVDWIFLPQLREFAIPQAHDHAYTCPFAEDGASVIKRFFAAQSERILTPEIGLSEHLRETTLQEICRVAARLGVSDGEARRALRAALDHQAAFERTYREEGQAALAGLEGPMVVLVGRPYVAYASGVNLSLPRKIASRGFHVVPADLLPFDPPANKRNVWHFTQIAASAASYVRRAGNAYVCHLSCFSCGPDAIVYHRVRHELEGLPVCSLEIDSHTADAGIDTRVGAFLDIIEGRRQLGTQIGGTASLAEAVGHVAYGGKKPTIVTDAGEVLGFDDPQVVHVLLADMPPITGKLFAALYGHLGWRSVVTPLTNADILQAARRVCSGRECLPFLSMVGKMVLYLRERDPNEVTLFHLLEQEGPCQIGNWFDASSLIFRRLGARNAFPVWPSIGNNYLGGGEQAAVAVTAAAELGDLLGEARSSLRCLAREPQEALATLGQMEERLTAAAGRGLLAAERELRRVAAELALIPLRGRPEDAPKVLLFSGINRIFVDRPVRDFFEQHGILAKTADIGEFFCLYETESVARRGFALGRLTPAEQFAPGTLLAGILRNPLPQPRFQAVRARVHVAAIELLDHRWRTIMARSGLVFSPDFHYGRLIRAGHEQISVNGWTEAPFTVGRYLASLEEGVFDGYVNVGAFNCTPAATATAAAHGIALRSQLPYAVIESDGASLTASQVRQLEAVAAQCWERKGRSALQHATA